MVSVRKRRKLKSSTKKVTQKKRNLTFKINFKSNAVVRQNWDKSLTFKQNYRKLGLTSKVNNLTGSTEKKIEKNDDLKKMNKFYNNIIRPEEIGKTEDELLIPEGEARIIRDEKTNKILKILYGKKNINYNNEKPKESTFIEDLRRSALKNSKKVCERKPSRLEGEWLKSLYEKYGDDYERMMWDKDLNVMQQCAGDIKRRMLNWKRHCLNK